MNAPAEHPSRREREAARHRAEILSVAEALFSDKGYLATTMEEVARRAEFAVGSLYKFFRSKEELYMGVLQENAGEIEPAVRQALAHGRSPREQIESYMRARIEIFWQKPHFFRIFFEDIQGGMLGASPGISSDLKMTYEGFLDSLSEVFARGVRCGEFLEAAPVLLTHLLEGHLRGYFTLVSRRLNIHRQSRNAEEESAMIEAFMKGALRR